jgi:hypothetical protein
MNTECLQRGAEQQVTPLFTAQQQCCPCFGLQAHSKNILYILADKNNSPKLVSSVSILLKLASTK